jgi:hypothetical protein
MMKLKKLLLPSLTMIGLSAVNSVNAATIASQTFDTPQDLKVTNTTYTDGRGDAFTTYAGSDLGFVAAGWASGSSAGPFEVSSTGQFYSGDTSGSNQALSGPGKYAPTTSITYPDVRRVTYALFNTVDMSGYDSSTLSLDFTSVKNGVDDSMFVRLYLDGSTTGIDLLTIDGANTIAFNATNTTFSGGATPSGTLTYSFEDTVTSAELYIGFEADGTGDHWTLDNVSFDGTAVPEPSTTALLGLGGLALILRRRK